MHLLHKCPTVALKWKVEGGSYRGSLQLLCFYGSSSSTVVVAGRGKDSAYVTEHQYRPAALQLGERSSVHAATGVCSPWQGKIVTAVLISSHHIDLQRQSKAHNSNTSGEEEGGVEGWVWRGGQVSQGPPLLPSFMS